MNINSKPQGQQAAHSPGPWQMGSVITDTPNGYPRRNIYALDEKHIARVIADDTREANAARIVACVNFLEGVPTEWLLANAGAGKLPRSE